MANPQHLEIIKKGSTAWNEWRITNPEIKPDLWGADFSGENLVGVDLSACDITEGQFVDTNLTGALFLSSNLTCANLQRANLWNTNFKDARLRMADLREANLRDAYFKRADLTEANLSGAVLVGTNFEKAILRGCNVYGCSCWNVKLSEADQSNLVIRRGALEFSEIDELNLYELKDELPSDYIARLAEPAITVDNLEVAQFIYTLLNNKTIRSLIDTITSKVVLILGNFNDQRKPVLDAMREELRKNDYVPVLFDFSRPNTLSYEETITLLARMARFIIADVTDAREVRAELTSIAQQLPSVPIQPLLKSGEEEWATFKSNFRNRSSVLPLYRYRDLKELITKVPDKVVRPAEKKAKELRG
ncbi:MAG: pentapeptide repeat-containing protein [Proteobacteria bacterium]|nr:pentapeptide repeat-containing protein [Pseudomonadota bacterium]